MKFLQGKRILCVVTSSLITSVFFIIVIIVMILFYLDQVKLETKINNMNTISKSYLLLKFIENEQYDLLKNIIFQDLSAGLSGLASTPFTYSKEDMIVLNRIRPLYNQYGGDNNAVREKLRLWFRKINAEE